MNDAEVREVLRLLKIGKVKAKQGKSMTWVSGPVDFSDLRTEYIGMMYEGLLDYELRQATEEQGGVVFLKIGQEPALPLSLLQSLEDKELKDLIQKLGKEKTSGPSDDDDADEDAEDLEEGAEEAQDEIEEEPDDDAEELGKDEALRQHVHEWACHAAEIAGKVKKPKGKKAELSTFERDRDDAARKLVGRAVAPGEMYLIRSSGTRKGTGTFYTRPQLAVPTAHRTLEPLVYDTDGEKRVAKTPEVILSLKVCDPAMGSSRSHGAWPWMPRGTCTWRTPGATASRSSRGTGPSSPNGAPMARATGSSRAHPALP